MVLSPKGGLTKSKYIITLIFSGVIFITFGCASQHTPISTPTILSPTASRTVNASEAIPAIDAMFPNLADEELFSGAALVAHQGEVLLSKGYGFADRERKISNTPQAQFQIASMTKQFTAVAILNLQEQGQLSVFDRICNFIVDCPTAWQEITIHHLLTGRRRVCCFEMQFPTLKHFSALRLLSPRPPLTIT